MRGRAVLKLGGKGIEDPQRRQALGRALRTLPEIPLLVHGGGGAITRKAQSLGIEPRFVRGVRFTDERMLEIVEETLTHLGKRVAHDLTLEGIPSVSLSGRDALLLEGRIVDPSLGLVGEVVSVRVDLLSALLSHGFVPVVSPLAAEGSRLLNVNADEVASAIAVALRSSHLLLSTDVPGVLDSEGHLLRHLSPPEAQRLLDEGVVQGGMIPKLECALRAVQRGVSRVTIGGGEDPRTIVEILLGKGGGTTVGGI